MNNGRSDDESILRELNDAYLHSDQYSDVARYDEFLAEDSPRPCRIWCSATARSSST